MMTTRGVILSGAVAAWAFAGIGCGRPHEAAPAAERPAIAAPVAVAEEESWTGGAAVSASVEPFRRAMPGTMMMGRVERVAKREGERVREGETLAVVDSRDAAARQAQAEAQLGAARAAEENARLFRERMERLVARQAASRKNVEDAVLGFEAAEANRKAAEQAVAAAKAYGGYARVAAPFDGVVVKRMTEIGDMTAPGVPLFVVEDLSKMKVEATVPESMASTLSAGAPVEVEVDGGGAPRAGTIAEVLPAADPRSRTVTLRVVLDNADGALRSGSFARVRPGGGSRRGIVVPDAAVVTRGPLAGIFVADADGIARLRIVTLGEARDGRVEVLTGLSAGERFVTAPPADLADGARLARGGASR